MLLQRRGEFRSERNVSSLFGMIARHNRNMCEYTFSYKENPLLGASAPDFLQFLDSAVQHRPISDSLVLNGLQVSIESLQSHLEMETGRAAVPPVTAILSSIDCENPGQTSLHFQYLSAAAHTRRRDCNFLRNLCGLKNYLRATTLVCPEEG